jgi:predicted O-methyltransferase YrrM
MTTYLDVKEKINGIPFIRDNDSKYIFDFIIENNVKNALELGFAHGASSCYMAAALGHTGGKLTSVDLESAKNKFSPSISELIALFNFKNIVFHYYKTGYNWFLHDALVKRKVGGKINPIYDLIIIDGPKNWTIDSSAFFCCELLLKDGGAIIFDDVNWSYDSAAQIRSQTDNISHSALSTDELAIPHVREIVNLLVETHPNIYEVNELYDSDWVIAKKKTNSKSLLRTFELQETLAVKILKYIRKITN